MSYYANGDGCALLKNDVSCDKIREVLNGVSEETGILFELVTNDEMPAIEIWEEYTNWHEEDTWKFLDAVAPFIISGEMTYCGEEDCHWKYVFEDGSWKEVHGQVVYGEDEMIAELEKLGYKVTKEVA